MGHPHKRNINPVSSSSTRINLVQLHKHFFYENCFPKNFQMYFVNTRLHWEPVTNFGAFTLYRVSVGKLASLLTGRFLYLIKQQIHYILNSLLYFVQMRWLASGLRALWWYLCEARRSNQQIWLLKFVIIILWLWHYINAIKCKNTFYRYPCSSISVLSCNKTSKTIHCLFHSNRREIQDGRLCNVHHI